MTDVTDINHRSDSYADMLKALRGITAAEGH